MQKRKIRILVAQCHSTTRRLLLPFRPLSFPSVFLMIRLLKLSFAESVILSSFVEVKTTFQSAMIVRSASTFTTLQNLLKRHPQTNIRRQFRNPLHTRLLQCSSPFVPTLLASSASDSISDIHFVSINPCSTLLIIAYSRQSRAINTHQSTSFHNFPHSSSPFHIVPYFSLFQIGPHRTVL